ncbi:MAG: DUF2279 domain-containing protein [Bacteroidota bacterium]|nr:DUF2279 domain-containing protein [Bacteroidota bacterium]
MKKLIFILIIVLQFAHSQPVKQSQNDSLFLGIEKKTFMTYGLVVYSASSLYVEYKWWWEGNYHPFKHENDGFWNNYSVGVDKIGHFYTSYLYFHFTYDILQWATFDEETSLWLAIAFPAANALSIEIGDGFSTYAFSNSDLIANSLGIAYSVLQKKAPFFENFTFKWSYYPSGIIPFDGRFRITDDYDGHLYWLSFNVHNLLPVKLQEYYPRWLNVAVGYGGKNISGRPSWVGPSITSSGKPQRKWAVSFDYNLMEIPLDGGLWNPLKSLLNNFKFPAPGLKQIQGQRAEFKPLLVN